MQESQQTIPQSSRRKEHHKFLCWVQLLFAAQYTVHTLEECHLSTTIESSCCLVTNRPFLMVCRNRNINVCTCLCYYFLFCVAFMCPFFGLGNRYGQINFCISPKNLKKYRTRLRFCISQTPVQKSKSLLHIIILT